MADTDKADSRKSPTDKADRDKESAKRMRPREGEGTAGTHPEDETLDLEEHLAGLWDVLGIGDAEEGAKKEE